MLLYRENQQCLPTRQWLQQVSQQLTDGEPSLDACRNFLVDLGELEAAVVDAICHDTERCSPLTRLLRRATISAAGRFLSVMQGNQPAAKEWHWRAHAALTQARAFPLPETALARVPEGFAYYGLYPEQYARSAEMAYSSLSPSRAVVIGLRSIGTTLAAVVAARLAQLGCPSASYTLRPRGHPFAREVSCEAALWAELLTDKGAHFLVVDEGPGLSGSSLTSVALALRQAGVPSARIVFLPSYDCDGSQLRNGVARAAWSEHAHFAAEFEQAWIEPVVPGATLRELSAGAWQSWLGGQAEHVSCDPQRERRKYLATTQAQQLMLRFAGFGRYGRRVRARAELLERSGVTPRVLGASHGMLVLEHTAGRMLTSAEIGASLLSTVAEYLAFRQRELRLPEPAPLAPLAQMARENVAEALGPGACRGLSGLLARAAAATRSATITDGRLQPHEWIVRDGRFRKVDAFDHGDDHFYPGPCDIAWDVAGAGIELGLSAAARSGLLALYVRASGDVSLAERLPFYEVAYLAFRIAVVGSEQSRGSAGGLHRPPLLDGYKRALAQRLLEAAR